ncbi:MAG TPA: ABC transporter ATP-binding protein [Elusimicrobiota bacterium]|jgi:spermidine/putrescine transport system ATP-binding protein|nr:ABC transporter ATP-binding protein [Elusimicrobiota bacterium]
MSVDSVGDAEIAKPSQPLEDLSIELRGIAKSFKGVPAVHSVDLSVRKGEFFALLGPSGCGKTTLLRMIAGFEFPDRGEIRLQGRDVANVPPNERPVNMVFQHYALFPHLTVSDNIAFGLRMRRLPKDEVARRVREGLEIVQLVGMEGRYPHQLSGGQQQRVALARAVVNRPEVLLLDEPMAALDEKLRKSMRAELKELQHRIGISFIYVTHDQGEALELADRIAVMEKGKVMQIGTPQEIYESPRSTFVADFVGVSNLLQGKVVEAEQLLGESNGARRRIAVDVEGVGRVAAFTDHALEPGAAVVLSLRPERIHLSASPVGELENRVASKVERAIFLGSDVHYRLKLASGRVLLAQSIYSPLRRVRREGERIFLQWRAEDASVLPE